MFAGNQIALFLIFLVPVLRMEQHTTKFHTRDNLRVDGFLFFRFYARVRENPCL